MFTARLCACRSCKELSCRSLLCTLQVRNWESLKNPVEWLAILLGIHKLPRSNIHLKPSFPGKYVVLSRVQTIKVVESSSGSPSLFTHSFQWINTLHVHLFYRPWWICYLNLTDLWLWSINFVTLSKFWYLSVIFYFFNLYVSGIMAFVHTEVIPRQRVV